MNIPTKITVSRIIAAIVLVLGVIALDVVYKVNQFTSPFVITLGEAKIDGIFAIIFGVFVLASITDAIDGSIARKRNEVTPLGKFLDPVADKILISSMLLYLTQPERLATFNTVQTVSVAMWCAMAMILRDIVVEALRFIAASKNVVIPAHFLGKLKTVLQMVAICVVLLNDFPFCYIDASLPTWLKGCDIVMYLAAACSIISGLYYVIKYRRVLKDNCYSKKDVVKALKEKGITLGSVESFTGGLFSSEITKVAGASKYFKGGMVTYGTSEKIALLGVDENTIGRFGAISKECASEMATNGRTVLGVDLCISFTGNAGPDAMENKPVGECYIACSTEAKTEYRKLSLSGSREKIQKEGVELSYELIVEMIEKYF